MNYLILLPVLLLISSILINSFYSKNIKIKNIILFFISLMVLTCCLIFNFIKELDLTIISLTKQFYIGFKSDKLANFLSVPISFIFLIVLIYSYSYLNKEKNQTRFYNFYFLTWSMMFMFLYSSNLFTLYIFFEMITLCSMPLVLHHQTRESLSAAKKYLYYSIGGAFLALLGIVILSIYGEGNLDFLYGGGIKKFNIHHLLCQFAVLLILIGFGVKAGLFPFHSWLIKAHPVAPANASAILSGVVTKAGVIAIIRVVFYVIDIKLIQNSFVQYIFLSLSVFSILMGSLLACFEKNLKTRLAYSTISQVSYMLSALLMLNEIALKGALFHLIAHMLIKVGLFLFAGIMIYQYQFHNVEELDGIGKKSKSIFVCFNIFSLALIGVPFTIGFVSKWFMANGALCANIKVFDILLPIALILSAILTAAYLLPIVIKGWINKQEYEQNNSSCYFKIPLSILAILIIYFGIFVSQIEQIILKITGK